MVHPCDKPCGNKTASGYCATTACINPQYSNIGTVQYGQGVQKCIITNADRIRSMSDEELADFLGSIVHDWGEGGATIQGKNCTYIDDWFDWLKQEAPE